MAFTKTTSPRSVGGHTYTAGGFRYDDGMTPRQRLEHLKGVELEIKLKREKEEWQTREQAEAAAQETANLIGSDLYGTLPLALAARLGGKTLNAAEVRLVVRSEVDAVVRQWVKAGRVLPESILASTPAPKSKPKPNPAHKKRAKKKARKLRK
jgi:hypothetical protein